MLFQFLFGFFSHSPGTGIQATRIALDRLAQATILGIYRPAYMSTVLN